MPVRSYVTTFRTSSPTTWTEKRCLPPGGGGGLREMAENRPEMVTLTIDGQTVTVPPT